MNQINFHAPESLADALKRECERQAISQSEGIRRAVEAWLAAADLERVAADLRPLPPSLPPWPGFFPSQAPRLTGEILNGVGCRSVTASIDPEYTHPDPPEPRFRKPKK